MVGLCAMFYVKNQYERKKDGACLSGIQMVGLSGIQMAFKYQTIWHLTSFWPFKTRLAWYSDPHCTHKLTVRLLSIKIIFTDQTWVNQHSKSICQVCINSSHSESTTESTKNLSFVSINHLIIGVCLLYKIIYVIRVVSDSLYSLLEFDNIGVLDHSATTAGLPILLFTLNFLMDLDNLEPFNDPSLPWIVTRSWFFLSSRNCPRTTEALS